MARNTEQIYEPVDIECTNGYIYDDGYTLQWTARDEHCAKDGSHFIDLGYGTHNRSAKIKKLKAIKIEKCRIDDCEMCGDPW